MTTVLSESTSTTAAIVLLSVIFIAYGGTFVLKVTRGDVPANDLQQRFYRAGHAHAGVLVILGLVVNLYVDLGGVTGWGAFFSGGVLWAAVLMPAGFFLSVTGRAPQRPNVLIALVWLGAASLVVGVSSTAIALLSAA
ncbi:MAG: hypothetical protein WA962_01025 [Ornithinimicrobium sp.]